MSPTIYLDHNVVLVWRVVLRGPKVTRGAQGA
jgi:hypothetical protein